MVVDVCVQDRPESSTDQHFVWETVQKGNTDIRLIGSFTPSDPVS